MLWIAIASVGVLVFLAFLVWQAMRTSRGRRLPSAVAKRHWDQWKNLAAITDDHRKVMEAEKIVDSAITQLGYTGTFADKLRKAGPRFSRVQDLWSAHKLRNRIAHEMGMTLSNRDVSTAMGAFERALKDLC